MSVQPETSGAPPSLHVVSSLITHPVEWACGLLMAAITVCVFLQVITRYVLAYPFDWPEELARFLFVWVALLGSVLALRRASHFSIGSVAERLPVGVRRWVRVGLKLVLLLFLMLVTWLGLDATVRVKDQLSAAMEIPMSYGYAAVPVGFGLLAWEMARQLWRELAGGAR